MANYFVDSTTGSDGDNGTTMDLAWATIEYALEAGLLNPGDIVWVRRTHAETPVSDILPSYNGSPSAPIILSGWPRAADATANGATWTNSSTTVDLVTTLSMDREKYLGRFVTAPDGNTYMITKIIDSNTFIIDRKYVGLTVSGVSGAFTIHADEAWVDDMGTEYGFDDSGWAIQEIDWDADPDDLAEVDFDGGLYQLYWNSDILWIVNNFDFKGSVETTGIIYLRSTKLMRFNGCLLHAASQECFTTSRGNLHLHRCILVGNAPGGSNMGISQNASHLLITDSALYKFHNAIYNFNGRVQLENVNLGVEIGNTAFDIVTNSWGDVIGKDVIFGAAAGALDYTASGPAEFCSIENYGKVLGAHKTFNGHGTLVKLDVVDGSGDPYKRPGGADSVIEILYNEASPSNNLVNLSPLYRPSVVFTNEFNVTNANRSYRYYVQTDTETVSASQLWIEVEYVSSYSSSTAYTHLKVTSDEAIDVRSDVDDWSQYIEVTDIQPAVAGKVRIKCYCSYYHPTAKIYIDPKPEIT
jgi:hypothetical protein